MEKLIDKIVKKNCPVVVGLDPNFEYIPEYIKKSHFNDDGETLQAAAKAVFDWGKELIDAVQDIVPAIKPQAAYFEMYGHYGIRTLSKLVKYAKLKGLYVILDGKRNDIGSTMDAYGKSYLGTVKVGEQELEPFGADSLTVNGYLGTDTVAPLIDICKEKDRSLFILCKTSNPSAMELQNKFLIDKSDLTEQDGKYVTTEKPKILAENMAILTEKWNENFPVDKYGYGQFGIVVGATQPNELKLIRDKFGKLFFLIPGYGSQGGKAEDIALGFDKNGIGGIVNASRSIMLAYKKDGKDERSFAESARNEAIRMRNEILSAIKN